jgi:glycosidase
MARLNLEVGAFGGEVENLHRNLAKYGSVIPSSEVNRSFFGPGTRDAVIRWQRNCGLPVTGIVDERTNAALEAAQGSDPIQPVETGPSPGLGTAARSVSLPLQGSGQAVLLRTAVPSTGPSDIFAPEITKAFAQARDAASKRTTKDVTVHGTVVPVRYPFPSPTDWQDCWIYFLILDRFANDQAAPKGPWNQRFDFRQGGTFNGVTAQLDYLRDLGVKALWLSPVLKNPRPDWRYNYHGYDTQDFVNIDERFASDRTLATAERELAELVAQAHARGLYVILDIVINDSARVFDYVRDGRVVDIFVDPAVLNGPSGEEPPIQWLNGYGAPRADWQDQIPPGTPLSPDDAVYPVDLQKKAFFRCRGAKLSDEVPPEGFAKGDFDNKRQLVVEYDAASSSEAAIRFTYGATPVLNILIRAYQYLIARFDFDAFRIDAAKYVSPHHAETFGNAIREFAQALGKRNFFMFAEIADTEKTIAEFVGRHSTTMDGFGIDAALDYPVFVKLPRIIKGWEDVAELRGIFENRKKLEEELICSHGEAGRYFVTFLDNHDQHERFAHPLTPQAQLTMGMALLFCLQGIPAIYYGTEQGLNGTVDKDGNLDLTKKESVREALWGKTNAFDSQHFLYAQIKALSRVRDEQPALRFGRQYFRQVSGNGQDYEYSSGIGGVIAFSRVLSDMEVLVVANTNTLRSFNGFVLQDLDLNRPPRQMRVAYSNLGTVNSGIIRQISEARFSSEGQATGTADIAALFVALAPMEVKVWVPA